MKQNIKYYKLLNYKYRLSASKFMMENTNIQSAKKQSLTNYDINNYGDTGSLCCKFCLDD